MVSLAIIDDGVNDSQFHVGTIRENVVVNKEGHVYRQVKDINAIVSKESHASLCAAILRKYHEEMQVINITLAREKQDQAIAVGTLIRALELCLDLQVDILHLSLCTNEHSYYYPLLDLINKIHKKGVIIVAAVGLEEQLSIPACFSNVIGVMHSPFSRHAKFRLVDNSLAGINVVADSRESLVMKNGKSITVGGQSSYVVPYICSQIAHSLNCEGKTKDEIGRIYRCGEEKGLDWLVEPYIFIMAYEQQVLLDEFIIFDEFKVRNIILGKGDLAEGIYCLQEQIRKLQRGVGIIIVDKTDESWENIDIDKKVFEGSNIALLAEEKSFVNKIAGCKTNRLFTLSKFSERVLIQNKATADVEIVWKVYHDEDDIRELLLDAGRILLMSFEGIHMLYGIEYLPNKLLGSEKELNKYIASLAYIYGCSKVCILVRDYGNQSYIGRK